MIGSIDNVVEHFVIIPREKDFGIDCIEFVDQFFQDKAKDEPYLKTLKKRAEDEGVTMGLIMVDTTGPLGAETREARDKAVDKTKAWIYAARFLGCSTVRINAHHRHRTRRARRFWTRGTGALDIEPRGAWGRDGPRRRA